MRYIRSGATVSLATVLFALVATDSVRAEIRVAATADIIRVQAHDASVEDVLTTLHRRFGLQYRSATPLRFHVSGTYEGSLQWVVRRLLEGYDFFINPQARAVKVVIIGPSRVDSQFGAAPPVEKHPYCKIGIAGRRLGTCK